MVNSGVAGFAVYQNTHSLSSLLRLVLSSTIASYPFVQELITLLKSEKFSNIPKKNFHSFSRLFTMFSLRAKTKSTCDRMSGPISIKYWMAFI